MVRFVLIKRYAELSGYTEKAISRKIQSGVWLEGKHFRRAPDGHIMIDVPGVERWVEEERAAA